MLPRYKKIHKSYRQVKCIDLTFNPSKLCACNDELWVGGWDKGIYVFDLDLEQTNHIEHDQLEYVSSVIKTLTGMIVCDFKTGIHHLNHKGNYTNLICSGSFSDVCLTSSPQLQQTKTEDKNFIIIHIRNSVYICKYMHEYTFYPLNIYIYNSGIHIILSLYTTLKICKMA